MIEVWSEGDKTSLGQPIAEGFDGVVQSPPGMENQYASAFILTGAGQDNHRVESVTCQSPPIVPLQCYLEVYYSTKVLEMGTHLFRFLGGIFKEKAPPGVQNHPATACGGK